MWWRKYTGLVYGLELKGDPRMPPTTWWNLLVLQMFYWDEATVLEVPEGVDRYRVGYIPFRGSARILPAIMDAPRFAVRHGREDCRFFAVMLDGTELPLKIACRTNIGDLPNNVLLV